MLCVEEDLLVAWVWAATNPESGLIDTYVLFHGTVQRKLGDNMTLEQFLMMGALMVDACKFSQSATQFALKIKPGVEWSIIVARYFWQ